MITEAELEAASRQLSAIRSARENLAKHRENLELFEKCRKTDQWPDHWEWKPSITLRKSERYGPSGLQISVKLPWQVVQQQLVYAVSAAERALIAAGG